MNFNQILIIDSIPEGERNTARNLEHDVDLRAQAFGNGPRVVRLRVESSADFLVVVEASRHAVETGEVVPLLHVECHGSPDGLEFADGTSCTWADLKAPLVRLNAETGLNLMVIVSACNGVSLAKIVALHERSPFVWLIGPNRIIEPEQLERSFLIFYETLLRTRSAQRAVDALHASGPPGAYTCISAQMLFQGMWNDLMTRHHNEEGIRAAAQRLHEREVPPNVRRRSVEEFDQDLRDYNPRFFAECRDIFFMSDLFPENAERFEVVYQVPPQPA